MSYDDDEESIEPVDPERLFTCPSCKTTFKLRVSEFRGQQTVKCINAACGGEIPVEVKNDSMSRFDRAMDDLDRNLDKLSDFKFDF